MPDGSLPVGERLTLPTALRIAWRPVAVIAGGVLLAAAFPSIGWWWAAPIAVGLFTLVAVTSPSLRASFGWTLLGGFVASAILIQWLSVLGVDAWLALALYSSLWYGLTGLASRAVYRLPWWPVFVASIWVLQEALRGRVPLGGFPWGRLAFSQADAPTLGLAALGGGVLITFAVALTGALLAGLLLSWREITRRRRAAVLIACAGIIAAGWAVPRPVDGQDVAGPANAVVALVQGSVPRTGLDAMAERQAVLNNHVAATMRLAADIRTGKAQQPVAVIWPENSTDIDPLTNSDVAQRITAAADAVAAPILVGAVTVNPTQPDTLWNVGIVWQPGRGPSEYYVKRHPVPFGEYVPFRSALQPLISRFDRVPYDFAAGSMPGVLQLGPVRIGDVICFEIAYDEVVTDVVAHGARALAVQTNNATYLFDGAGGQAQPDQQAAMSQVRAVEHGRSVLIAATSGVTAVIDPAGQVQAQLPFNTSGYLVHDVALRDSVTVATRFTRWLELLIVACATAGLAWQAIRVRRSYDSRNDAAARIEQQPGSGGPPDRQ